MNPARGIFILADGFGGTAGRIAAETATQSTKFFLEQEAGDLDATLPFELRPYYSLAGNVLFNAISYSNQKVLQKFKGKSWMESGGASLVAGYLEGKLLSIASVGACSVHLYRQGRVKEIVAPKTLGRQSNPFEDESGSGLNIPLMSFGTSKQLEPEMTELEVKPGDQFCFQSSGVSQDLLTAVLSLEKPDQLSQIIDHTLAETNATVLWLAF